MRMRSSGEKAIRSVIERMAADEPQLRRWSAFTSLVALPAALLGIVFHQPARKEVVVIWRMPWAWKHSSARSQGRGTTFFGLDRVRN